MCQKKYYRQLIEDLFPSLQLPLTSDNTYQFTQSLAPTPQIQFDQVIFLILPLAHCEYKQCLLVYEHSIALVAHRSTTILKKILNHYHHLDPKVYKETIHMLMSEDSSTRHYKTPFANIDYSLFPLTKAQKPETIWLNPASVQDITSDSYATVVHLFNKISFQSPIETRSIKTNMYMSFLIHGIMKRDLTPTIVQEDMSLYEYLQLPYSEPIVKVIGDMSYADIPSKRGKFMDYYMAIQLEYGEQCIDL